MKYSIDPKYPGYVKENVAILMESTGIEVYLNGQTLQYIIAANSDNGTVVCIKRDKSGNPMIKDGEWITEIRRGNVSIFIPDEIKEMLK